MAAYVSLAISILAISLWQAPVIEAGFGFGVAVAVTTALLWITARLLIRARGLQTTHRYSRREPIGADMCGVASAGGVHSFLGGDELDGPRQCQRLIAERVHSSRLGNQSY